MLTISLAALLLAQSCVAEIDIGIRPEATELRECKLMWGVHARQVGRDPVGLEPLVRRYVTVFVCENKRCDNKRLQRIRSMDIAGREPENWPANIGVWEQDKHRGRWLRLLAEAQAWLDQEMPTVAKGSCAKADQFGGSCEHATGACDHVPVCWQRVDCGDTLQAYYISRQCSQAVAATEAAGKFTSAHAK